MKYSDIEKQLNSGRFEKRRPFNPAKPVHNPARRREPDFPQTPDLSAGADPEAWLAERLKAHGHDIYAGGPYETYADRLCAAIVRNGVQRVIVGRNPEGKPETYEQFVLRIFSIQLKNVPRDTADTRHQTR